MKKFRLYFDKDKEEKWLNEMSRQGWAMQEFFFGVYVFTPCEPGEYVYRVDMPGGRRPIWEVDLEYIELVEETGAEFVCRWGLWMIFRKEASKGAFELYTDTESQIGLYRRIRRMFLLVGAVELSIALNSTRSVWGFWFGRDVLASLCGTDLFLFVCMCLIYVIVAGFFLISWRLTRKMHKLRRESGRQGL